MNQEWLERLVIASPIDISLVSIMHNLFANEFTIKAFALGGNFVLLTFKDKDIKEAFLSNGAPWLRRRFYDFQPCEEKLFHSKRTIRVRLYGTPLFLWSPHLFKWLGMKLGNFVSLDYSTSSKSRINYARIQITTESLDLLNKIVAVEVIGAIIFRLLKRLMSRCLFSIMEMQLVPPVHLRKMISHLRAPVRVYQASMKHPKTSALNLDVKSMTRNLFSRTQFLMQQ